MKLKILISMVFITSICNAQQNEIYKKGIEAYEKYDFQSATALFNECLKTDKTNVEIIAKLASSYFQLNNFDEAKGMYSKVVELDSTNRNALLQLSKIYTKEKQFNLALLQYEKLLRLDSNNVYFIRNYAKLLLENKDIEMAIANFKKCLGLNPKDFQSTIDLAKLYQDMGQLDLAEELVNHALLKGGENLHLFKELAKIEFQKKNYEATIQVADKAMQLSSDSSLLLLKLLGISYFQLGEYEKAIHLLTQVDSKSESSEGMNYYIGSCYLQLKEYDKSLKYMEKAIEQGISNNIDNYYINLATIYERQNEYKSSISAYQLAYQYSKNKLLLYHLARNYDIYYKDKTTAIRYYNKYLQANDTNNEVFQTYTRYRLSELKQLKHFDLDTLN